MTALPAILLAGAMSLYRGLLNSVGFALQLLTAQGAAATTSTLGLPVRRSGVDLFAPGTHLVVAQACSGMDSLLALLCLATLIVGVVPASLTRRAVLVALVLPIILVANVARVTLVLLLSQPFGSAVAQGLLHGFLSASLFVAAVALFGLAALALRCLPTFAGTRSSPA
jgi:exosortase